MSENELLTCNRCGSNIAEGSGEEFEGEVLCPDCFSGLAICDCCGDRYNANDDDTWGGMCQACSEDHFTCDGCDRTIRRDEGQYDDRSEETYCERCYEQTRRSRFIREYHDGADCRLVFHPDNKHPLYFGVELETDNYRSSEAKDIAAARLFDLSKGEELFWLEEDGSLNDGIEIITQPCTLDYHRDTFPWEVISKIVGENGGRSQDTSTCGLHIHFSRSFFDGHSELCPLRLIYLFEKFWDKLVQFSRRDRDACCRYANKYGRELFDCSAGKKIKELSWDFPRYQAVNIARQDTIEIRIFRGTLHVNTILGSIELVDFLARLVKKTSTKKLQIMTWSDLLRKITSKKYHHLPQCLTERNLN